MNKNQECYDMAIETLGVSEACVQAAITSGCTIVGDFLDMFQRFDRGTSYSVANVLLPCIEEIKDKIEAIGCYPPM